MRTTICTIGLLLGAPVALAHHSRAEFSDDVIEIEGTLTEVVWQNPHIALFMDVVADDGSVERWRIEGAANPRGLEGAGIARELFVTGDHLVVRGNPSKVRNGVLATNVLLPNGVEALMAPRTASVWGGAVVGNDASPEVRRAEAATANVGFFRAWFPAGNPMMQSMRFPYTEAAAAARAQWDPVDNPIVRCEPAGLPNPLFHPQPILFEREGADIRLSHAYFDTQRTIHMDSPLRAADQPASRLGYSRGRWDGEHTLVIETSRIDYPYFDNRGTAQGPDITITERYTLSEDQSELTLNLTIVDPVALHEPASGEWRYVALDQPYAAYDCNVF
jgi:hypothetical protein